MVRSISSFLFLLIVVLVSSQEQHENNHSDGSGTKGKTDGEPGSNVEAHCCGMKGLGGAVVEVLCHPEQVLIYYYYYCYCSIWW